MSHSSCCDLLSVVHIVLKDYHIPSLLSGTFSKKAYPPGPLRELWVLSLYCWLKSRESCHNKMLKTTKINVRSTLFINLKGAWLDPIIFPYFPPITIEFLNQRKGHILLIREIVGPNCVSFLDAMNKLSCKFPKKGGYHTKVNTFFYETLVLYTFLGGTY